MMDLMISDARSASLQLDGSIRQYSTPPRASGLITDFAECPEMIAHDRYYHFFMDNPPIDNQSYIHPGFETGPYSVPCLQSLYVPSCEVEGLCKCIQHVPNYVLPDQAANMPFHVVLLLPLASEAL